MKLTYLKPLSFLIALISVLLAVMAVDSPMFAQTVLTPAEKQAVVRIIPCDGNETDCIRKDDLSGSGVFVTSDGLIITAYHVVVRKDSDPARREFWNDFNVEVNPDGTTEESKWFFRARVVATNSLRDLAVLRIDRYCSENQGNRIVCAPLNDVAEDINWIRIFDGPGYELNAGNTRLLILGYPKTSGNPTLYIEDVLLSSKELSQEALWIQTRLDPGYSGGPAIIDRDGQKYVTGVVLSAEGNRTKLRDLSVSFKDFEWFESEKSAFVESIMIDSVEEDGVEFLRFRSTVHTQGFEHSKVELRIFIYDFPSRIPWRPVNVSLPNRSGHIYLSEVIFPKSPIDITAVNMRIAVDDLSVPLDSLAFRLVLHKSDPIKQIWSDNVWYVANPSDSTEKGIIASTSSSPNTTTPTISTRDSDRTPAASATSDTDIVPLPTPSPTMTLNEALAVAKINVGADAEYAIPFTNQSKEGQFIAVKVKRRTAPGFSDVVLLVGFAGVYRKLNTDLVVGPWDTGRSSFGVVDINGDGDMEVYAAQGNWGNHAYGYQGKILEIRSNETYEFEVGGSLADIVPHTIAWSDNVQNMSGLLTWIVTFARDAHPQHDFPSPIFEWYAANGTDFTEGVATTNMYPGKPPLVTQNCVIEDTKHLWYLDAYWNVIYGYEKQTDKFYVVFVTNNPWFWVYDMYLGEQRLWNVTEYGIFGFDWVNRYMTHMELPRDGNLSPDLDAAFSTISDFDPTISIASRIRCRP